ncbi:MAG: SagB/ThcOx family dehydrogenase, partial [Halodesulfurarchaeum sp.]
MIGPLSRRTVAKLTGAAAAGVSAVLGGVFDGFEVDLGTKDGRETAVEREADLPRPQTATGSKRVADAIADRRSRREYGDEPLTRAELGQLLWAAQGVTQRRPGVVDFRAAPSAGATYPLEVFVVNGEPGVTALDPGIYQYDHDEHDLTRRRSGSFQDRLQEIAIDQEWVGAAALDLVITGVDERTTGRYGRRGRLRYVPMEAGHVGENIYLQAESLGLATVAIGAFRDRDLREL